MGAGNALGAYQRYAGQVPPLSMQVLTYMALVSLDADQDPWYSEPQETFAEMALGRTAPVTESDLRALRRALTPLFECGAITTERHSSNRPGHKATARYGLNVKPFATVHSLPEPA